MAASSLLRVALVLVTSSLSVRGPGNPSAMTSSAAEDSRLRSGAAVTVQLAIEEEQPSGTPIGDLRQSLSLQSAVDASRLNATTFQTLPRPNQNLEALRVDRRTGVVRATDVRLDRETVCPGHEGSNGSTDCTMDISVGLVRSLHLEQVQHCTTLLCRCSICFTITSKPFSFLFFASAIVINVTVPWSVCLSVCLSVRHVHALCSNGRRHRPDFFRI